MRPAERAVIVGLQPRVDAVDVEGMGAVGEETEELLVLELGQTDGTFYDRGGGSGVGLETEGGDGVDGRQVEAVGVDGVVVGGRSSGYDCGRVAERAAVEEEEELWAAPVKAAFGDEDVVAEEEDGGGEDAEDGDCEDREASVRRGGVGGGEFWIHELV